MQVIFVTFNFNCRLHAVSVGKTSEPTSNFWTVQFLKTESEPIFGFMHTPNNTDKALSRVTKDYVATHSHNVMQIVLLAGV